MLLLDRLAEEQINAAIRRGELENLPGSGQPLTIEDDALVPESLRVAHRMLSNAGCLPPELTLRNEDHQTTDAHDHFVRAFVWDLFCAHSHGIKLFSLLVHRFQVGNLAVQLLLVMAQ